MKLCYNVYGKDAGHIKTKDPPQNRGNSVNDVWLAALSHRTSDDFNVVKIATHFSVSPKPPGDSTAALN